MNNTPCVYTIMLYTCYQNRQATTAHTLKYERSEELGKNLALGGIYRLPKFLKISKQNKFPQKNYRYNIIPLYFETFNKLKSTDMFDFDRTSAAF